MPSVGGELTVSVFQSTPALALTTLTSCSSCRFFFSFLLLVCLKKQLCHFYCFYKETFYDQISRDHCSHLDLALDVNALSTVLYCTYLTRLFLSTYNMNLYDLLLCVRLDTFLMRICV